MHVLLTGMSGTGKSTLVRELRRLGFEALDADDDGFTEPAQDGRWRWKLSAVQELLEARRGRLVFFAGCSEEQGRLPFDVRILLRAPAAELVRRLDERTTNSYGRSDAERAQVLADLADVEPLLVRSSDLVVETTVEPSAVAEAVIAFLEARGAHRARTRP